MGAGEGKGAAIALITAGIWNREGVARKVFLDRKAWSSTHPYRRVCLSLFDYRSRKSLCGAHEYYTAPSLLTAPLRCHSLKRRLAVKGVTLAALANSSFVISSSIPPGTLCPMP